MDPLTPHILETAPPASPEDLRASLALLGQIKAGDREAMDRLFRRYADRLLRIVRLQLGPGLRNKLESMDILQETFLLALRDIRGFEPRSEGALLHWFSTLIKHRICGLHSHFHRSKRNSSRETALDGAREDGDLPSLEAKVPDRDPTPSRALAVREEMRRVETALDGLGEELKEIVILKAFEGMTFEEVAALKGKTPDAVRMAYSRAVVKVNASLNGTHASSNGRD